MNKLFKRGNTKEVEHKNLVIENKEARDECVRTIRERTKAIERFVNTLETFNKRHS